MCMNVYDVRKLDTLPECGMNWPEDLSEATRYLDVCLKSYLIADISYQLMWWMAAQRGEGSAQRQC